MHASECLYYNCNEKHGDGLCLIILDLEVNLGWYSYILSCI